jgi:CubicO group peptidase (beta-lactamase class C family)
VAQGQAGVIYNGSSIKVNANSRWLLGSITKSVTAILTAKLVEEGLVGWDETLPELLPDVKMNEQWNHVTLSELIHHTAGFDDAAIMQQVDASTLEGSPGEQRTQVASLILAGTPAWTPGTHYEYSSLDYVIIGAILERRVKQDYETLVSTKVLEPLGLYSHGFLNPAAGEDRESQPWGHFDGVPQDPDLPDTGVPPVLASTGGVNLTIEDLAYYAADNLSGEQGYCTVLTKDMWTKLHYETSAASTVYACGWEVGDFAQYLGAKDFSHSGCDNTFTTEVIAAPALDMCIVMSTNEGDENKSADALYDAFVMVLDHYGIDYGAK